MKTETRDPSRIIARFKGRIREREDGTRVVRVPALTVQHVVSGDRMYVTAGSVEGRARLMGLYEREVPVDSPFLAHESGDFIGTFTVDLATQSAYRAAKAFKSEAVSAYYAMSYGERTQRLLDFENATHERVLAIMAGE